MAGFDKEHAYNVRVRTIDGITFTGIMNAAELLFAKRGLLKGDGVIQLQSDKTNHDIVVKFIIGMSSYKIVEE